jgi:hypothetical protein
MFAGYSGYRREGVAHSHHITDLFVLPQRLFKPASSFEMIAEPATKITDLAHVLGTAAFDLAFRDGRFDVCHGGGDEGSSGSVSVSAFMVCSLGDKTLRNQPVVVSRRSSLLCLMDDLPCIVEAIVFSKQKSKFQQKRH